MALIEWCNLCPPKLALALAVILGSLAEGVRADEVAPSNLRQVLRASIREGLSLQEKLHRELFNALLKWDKDAEESEVEALPEVTTLELAAHSLLLPIPEVRGPANINEASAFIQREFTITLFPRNRKK